MPLTTQPAFPPIQETEIHPTWAGRDQAQFSECQTNSGDAVDFRGQTKRKAEALRPALTPEQFERYQKFQQQQVNLLETLRHETGQ